jgi:anti-sigma regulatory factor (Ser/Thr protein kinase)
VPVLPSGCRERALPACIGLRLSSDQVRVLIEVWDGNPHPPATRPVNADGVPALDEAGGRGLFLVEALSQRWSWYPVAQEGKCVWCELATTGSGSEPVELTGHGRPTR